MLYRGNRYLNTCFVSVLRDLFKLHPIYTWKQKDLETKIQVEESFVRKNEKFPQVVVADVSSGQFFHSSLVSNIQKDVYEYDETLGREVYRGSIHGVPTRPTLTVTVTALTKFEVENIADYIASWFIFYGHKKFADSGIAIISIDGSAPSQERYGKENKYSIVFTFHLQCDWQHFEKYDDIYIESINLPRIDIESPDGVKHHDDVLPPYADNYNNSHPEPPVNIGPNDFKETSENKE